MSQLKPASTLGQLSAYSVPRPPIPVDLYLHGNEGPEPPESVLDVDLLELLRAYPDTSSLAEFIAQREGVSPEHIIVTAGVDDALDRICRAMLEPGRTLILPEPTFVMFRRFAARAHGDVRSIKWSGATYPTRAVLDAIDEHTAMIAVVSPNNPTGAVASREDVRRLAEAAPQALVVVDHAYIEFGGEDCTSLAASYPNVLITRTLSKAWGMAGARVGYALAAPEVISWLRTAGLPYAVAGPSIALARRLLAQGSDAVDEFIELVAEQRSQLEAKLAGWGLDITPSMGNFVFARCKNPEEALWIRDALAGMGILVRAFPDDPLLLDAIRISCPGDEPDFKRLIHALETIFEPDALLFDLDGVIADVTHSYAQSLIATAAYYGVTVDAEMISEAKAAGDANNDWILTRRILAEHGVEVSLEEVTARFEMIYQGSEDNPGLRRTETMLVAHEYLQKLADAYPLGIVTGRPRLDAERFLSENHIAKYFREVVCMEDAALKPDPAPVNLLLDQLGARRAWLIGDTPDDARAARGARVLPIGIFAPAHDPAKLGPALSQAGCARILQRVDELEEFLP